MGHKKTQVRTQKSAQGVPGYAQIQVDETSVSAMRARKRVKEFIVIF